MNFSSFYTIWKEATSIGEQVGCSAEDVLKNALDLYCKTHIYKDTEPLNQFISDLDKFVKETLKDKSSVHYNFVSQWVDMIVRCEEPDSSFEFRMRKMVHILYKKNKEYSKQFLDELGVTRKELQDKILETVFGGDV